MRKLLKIFLILLLLVVVIYKGVDFLANIFEEDMKQQEEQKYVQLLEDFINVPVVKPDESIFDGIKRYKMGEWKYLEDKKLYVDANNNPITGIVENDTEWNVTITTIKDGVRNGNRLYFNKTEDKKQLWSHYILENDLPKKLTAFYDNGTPQIRFQNFGDYTIWCYFYKDGKRIYCQIRVNKEPSELIFFIYDKTGRKIEQLSTYTGSFCFQKNGKKRKLSKEEVDSFFNIQKQIDDDIENGVNDVEYDLHCE